MAERAQLSLLVVKRGRGRPRKHPLPPVAAAVAPAESQLQQEPVANETGATSYEEWNRRYFEATAQIHQQSRALASRIRQICHSILQLYDIHTADTSQEWALTALRLGIPEARRVLADAVAQFESAWCTYMTETTGPTLTLDSWSGVDKKQLKACIATARELGEEARDIMCLIQTHNKMYAHVLEIMKMVEPQPE